ncbi:hypothetical protein FOCC_FOCC016324 [Frankliniella occidentalis]|nr:hypothetical protein FOCC_FOCC016324 [Frankliniella occidentalis]
MIPGSLPLGDIRMGLCVPRSCEAATLQAALQAGLDPSVRVLVRPENCQEHVTQASISPAATLFWCLVVALTAVTVAAPALGWSSWDWSRHVRTLAQPDPLVSGIDLSPLSGIRSINAMYLVALHRGLHAARVATSNREYLTSWARSRMEYAVLYRGALGVDTFFFLAGLLLAATSTADRKSSFSKSMFNRVLRVGPVYAIVVLFHCTALPEMGAGPLWVEVAQPMAESCRKWWWSNLLFLNNYVNGGTAEPLVRTLACLSQVFYKHTYRAILHSVAAVHGALLVAGGGHAHVRGGDAAAGPAAFRTARRGVAAGAGRARHRAAGRGHPAGRVARDGGVDAAHAAGHVGRAADPPGLHADAHAHRALPARARRREGPAHAQAAVHSLLTWQPLVSLSRLTFAVYLVSYPLQALLTAAKRDAVRITPLTIARDALSDNVISFAVSFWLFVVLEAPIRSLAKKALARMDGSSKSQTKTESNKKSD